MAKRKTKSVFHLINDNNNISNQCKQVQYSSVFHTESVNFKKSYDEATNLLTRGSRKRHHSNSHSEPHRTEKNPKLVVNNSVKYDSVCLGIKDKPSTSSLSPKHLSKRAKRRLNLPKSEQPGHPPAATSSGDKNVVIPEEEDDELPDLVLPVQSRDLLYIDSDPEDTAIKASLLTKSDDSLKAKISAASTYVKPRFQTNVESTKTKQILEEPSFVINLDELDNIGDDESRLSLEGKNTDFYADNSFMSDSGEIHEFKSDKSGESSKKSNSPENFNEGSVPKPTRESKKRRTLRETARLLESGEDNVTKGNMMVYKEGIPVRINEDYNFENADHRIKKLYEFKKPIVNKCEQLKAVANHYNYLIKDKKKRISKENDNVAQFMVDIGIVVQNLGEYLQHKGMEMQETISHLRADEQQQLKQEVSDSDEEQSSPPVNTSQRNVPKNAEEVLKKTNICQLCGKSYANREDLETHLNKHADNMLTCGSCGKTFYSQRSYRTHIKAHEQGFHRCSICSWEFDEKKKLTAHFKRHEDREPFVCSIEGCTNSYKDRGSWIRHMKSGHNTEREVPCNLCDRYYKNEESMKSHLRRDH